MTRRADHTLTAVGAACTTAGLVRGVRLSVPLAVATVVVGTGFGLAAQQVGMPLWAAALMSGTVLAGAAQFAALPLWTAPLPFAPLWFSTLAVNARFSLLSASLASWLHRYRGATPWLAVALLVEGPWAVVVKAQRDSDEDLGVLLGSQALMWVMWVGGTVLGYVAAPALGDPKRLGLDLVLVLFFAGTLTSGWRGPRDLWPWGAAAAATFLPASIVAPQWKVLVAALVGAAVGAWRDARP